MLVEPTTVSPTRATRIRFHLRATCRHGNPTRTGTPRARARAARCRSTGRRTASRRVVDPFRRQRRRAPSTCVVGVPQHESRGPHLDVEQRPVRMSASHQCGAAGTGRGSRFRRLRSSPVPFTRAELESFRDRHGPRSRRPRPAAVVRRHQPRTVDGGDADPLRASRQPLLPGAARAGIIDRADRPGRRHDRRRPGAPDRTRHRHHQPRRPGDRQGVGAHGAPSCKPAASGCVRSSSAHRPRGRRGRRHHRVPRRVRRPSMPSPGRQPELFAAAPSSGSCRTRAASTPTRRSTPWPRRTAPRPKPPASSLPTLDSRQAARARPRARLFEVPVDACARRPSSNGVCARQPSSCSARGGVDAAARLTVGLGRIPAQLAVEADEAGDRSRPSRGS